MTKKMKTPDKTPPVATAGVVTTGNGGGYAPDVNVAEVAKVSLASVANAPQMEPPEVKKGAVAANETVVWNTDKRVNALYTTYHPHNSWMSIAGIGWKKLATGSDSACEAMTQLAAHCREKTCRIDFSEENGLVKEIYVW
jgi:hypothetical protein